MLDVPVLNKYINRVYSRDPEDLILSERVFFSLFQGFFGVVSSSVFTY